MSDNDNAAPGPDMKKAMDAYAVAHLEGVDTKRKIEAIASIISVARAEGKIAGIDAVMEKMK